MTDNMPARRLRELAGCILGAANADLKRDIFQALDELERFFAGAAVGIVFALGFLVALGVIR